MALCVKKQSGYVRCGWDTDTHAATTAAAPSTSTPPSELRQLLLLLRGSVPADDDAAAEQPVPTTVQFNTLHRLLRLLSPHPQPPPDAAEVPPKWARRHFRVRLGERRIELFLYKRWLQLRKLWRRHVGRRKQVLSGMDSTDVGGSADAGAGAGTDGGANADADADAGLFQCTFNDSRGDLCHDSGEDVSQLLWRRRRQQQRDDDRLRQQILFESEHGAEQTPQSEPTAHSLIHTHLPNAYPVAHIVPSWSRVNVSDSLASRDGAPKLRCIAEEAQEQTGSRSTPGRKKSRGSASQTRPTRHVELSAVHPHQVQLAHRQGAACDHVPAFSLVRPHGCRRAKTSAHLPKCSGLRLYLLQSTALVSDKLSNRFR